MQDEHGLNPKGREEKMPLKATHGVQSDCTNVLSSVILSGQKATAVHGSLSYSSVSTVSSVCIATGLAPTCPSFGRYLAVSTTQAKKDE